MYDFAIKGTVAGIYPTQDGSRMLMKIQPEKNPTNLERDEKPGLLAVMVPPNLVKNFGLNTTVLVRGKESVRLKESRGNDGKLRSFPRYTHEAESVEVVKAAA
jgi:hypothetical protein